MELANSSFSIRGYRNFHRVSFELDANLARVGDYSGYAMIRNDGGANSPWAVRVRNARLDKGSHLRSNESRGENDPEIRAGEGRMANDRIPQYDKIRRYTGMVIVRYRYRVIFREQQSVRSNDTFPSSKKKIRSTD